MRIAPIDENTKYLSSQKAKEATTMNQEEFLRVLITQMQNQNPMEPMDDFEFMSQITQFSMLDGINGMQSQINGLKALDYIGKNVIGTFMSNASTTSKYLEGLVESITLQDDSVILNLDSGSLYMDNVLFVY